MRLTLLVVLMALSVVAQGLAMLLGLDYLMYLNKMLTGFTYGVLAVYYFAAGLYYMLTKRYPRNR